jgi:hypothetical protein
MMTTNEIIEMAKKSNLLGVIDCFHYTGRQTWVEEATAFAKLVAAKEREACAKVCEELPAPDIYNNTDQSMWDVTCMDCSTAIRARAQADGGEQHE